MVLLIVTYTQYVFKHLQTDKIRIKQRLQICYAVNKETRAGFATQRRSPYS